jgi:hypothetical protein
MKTIGGKCAVDVAYGRNNRRHRAHVRIRPATEIVLGDGENQARDRSPEADRARLHVGPPCASPHNIVCDPALLEVAERWFSLDDFTIRVDDHEGMDE